MIFKQIQRKPIGFDLTNRRTNGRTTVERTDDGRMDGRTNKLRLEIRGSIIKYSERKLKISRRNCYDVTPSLNPDSAFSYIFLVFSSLSILIFVYISSNETSAGLSDEYRRKKFEYVNKKENELSTVTNSNMLMIDSEKRIECGSGLNVSE